MKRYKKIVLMFATIVIIFKPLVLANDSKTIDTKTIIEEQKKEIGISDFINLSEEYSNKNLDGINIKEIFEEAVTRTSWKY